MPRASRSVVISTRDDPERNSRMMTSRVFWSMSPCVADTVWSRSRILSVSQSTCGGLWWVVVVVVVDCCLVVVVWVLWVVGWLFGRLRERCVLVGPSDVSFGRGGEGRPGARTNGAPSLCLPLPHSLPTYLSPFSLTLRRVLAKMTLCVMASVSYRSQSVSSFHSSFSTLT